MVIVYLFIRYKVSDSHSYCKKSIIDDTSIRRKRKEKGRSKKEGGSPLDINCITQRRTDTVKICVKKLVRHPARPAPPLPSARLQSSAHNPATINLP